MTTSTTTEAFVLRTTPYGESDLIVALLGRQTGKFTAIARGARKSKRRFGGSLLPMRAIRARVSFKPDRDLAFLHEADVLRAYDGLEASFDKITLASYATELVRAATREADEATGIFDLLDEFYGRLAGSDEDPILLEVVLHHFELRLLAGLGAAPSLDACHRCGLASAEMDKLRASRSGEGIVCRSCLRGQEGYGVLEAATLEVLHFLQSPEGSPPDAIAAPSVLRQARRVIDASFDEILDGDLKSRQMLETVLVR